MNNYKREFKNELNNTITIDVSKKDINGIDGVLISIAGPISDTDIHITHLEARVLYEELGKVVI